jgi:prepilin signal peptidase PulO-like enzyme (type II secretory pathway)
MVTFFVICAGILGLIVGSFMNVVVLRHGTGRSITFDRSQCFSCGKILQWHELIPLFSYVFLRGKCSSCKTRISAQYPIVETGVGVAYAVSAWKIIDTGIYTFHESLILFGVLGVVWALAVAIAVYDFRHTIIPNSWVYLFMIVTGVYGVTTAMWEGGVSIFSVMAEVALAGLVLATPFALLWLFSRGTWMGLGDAKLTLAIGFFLGMSRGASALLLAVWTGAIVGVFLIIMHKYASLFLDGKRFTMKSEIPFGPFLIVGMVLIYVFDFEVWHWFLSL